MKLLIYILLLIVLFSCNKTEFAEPLSIKPNFEMVDEETLISAADFPIGNAWSSGHAPWGSSKGTDLGGPNDDFSYNAFGAFTSYNRKQIDLDLELEILRTEFNSITPEVALKMHCISITPDSIDFSAADVMMEFAEANGIRVHGHVLLFDLSIPEWAQEYEDNNVWTEEQWENWVKNYIHTVVGRYRGRIPAWDVLNEIANTLGSGLKNAESFWYRVMGPDYMKKALLWAEEADPDALLFINDNAQEVFPGKNNTVINKANELRAEGCRIDGIGYQGHIFITLFQGRYLNNWFAYKLAADNGYLVHLSELDLMTNIFGLTNSQSDLQHRIQRKRYNEIARAYIDAVPEHLRYGITIWNIADKNGFANIVQLWEDLRIFGGDEDYPLLFDNNYERKPAYYGFRNGLKGIEEGWFYPDLYDTERMAHNPELDIIPYRTLEEKEELDLYIEHSKKMMMEYYGFSQEDIQQMASQISLEDYGNIETKSK